MLTGRGRRRSRDGLEPRLQRTLSRSRERDLRGVWVLGGGRNWVLQELPELFAGGGLALRARLRGRQYVYGRLYLCSSLRP